MRMRATSRWIKQPLASSPWRRQPHAEPAWLVANASKHSMQQCFPARPPGGGGGGNVLSRLGPGANRFEALQSYDDNGSSRNYVGGTGRPGQGAQNWGGGGSGGGGRGPQQGRGGQSGGRQQQQQQGAGRGRAGRGASNWQQDSRSTGGRNRCVSAAGGCNFACTARMFVCCH